MKLSELVKGLDGKRLGDAEIGGLCTDSRVAERGDLFFCFRGENVDSHDFAEEAAERGVSAVVCEHELEIKCPQFVVENGRRSMALISAAYFGNPQKHMKLVGVTGTNGKTTICHMLREILRAKGENAGVIGTLGAQFHDRTIPPDLTTPDPVTLFSILAQMRKEGVTTVVMEVSAHAIALEKVSPILFEIGIFTNLTRDHLDFFGDMNSYGNAKKKLFHSCKFAIYNADDPFSVQLNRNLPFVTYGLETPADAFALIERETIKGSKILLNLCDDLCETELKLTGRHNVSNALAAACAGKRLGASCEQIAAGLQRVERVDGRLERVASLHGAEIFVDFAHTPDGLLKSLSCLKENCEGRLIALFGCGGNRDAGKRALMGETAAKLCDFAVLTSDNPRFEEPCSIIAEIERGYSAVSKNYIAIEERDRAIEFALKQLKEGDVLLVAGKGAETYQEIMGIKYDFNDKAYIESLLKKLS